MFGIKLLRVFEESNRYKRGVFQISILLNISKDHLDRYENFKNYISAKKNILNKGDKNINLISLDDKYSKKIYNNQIK